RATDSVRSSTLLGRRCIMNTASGCRVGVLPVSLVWVSKSCELVLRVRAGPVRRSVSAFVVVSGFVCPRPQQSFALCFPGSPSAPRGFSPSRTRREVSGACGLSVSLHGSLLDRFVVGACTHVPRACARGSGAIHTYDLGHGSCPCHST